MALTATGIGSGLDISTIVKVLVDAEKLPKEAIFNRTEDRINAKVSAIGTLKSALSNFQDAEKSCSQASYSANVRFQRVIAHTLQPKHQVLLSQALTQLRSSSLPKPTRWAGHMLLILKRL